MRAEGTRNTICLKAYAGTTGVMLAMNVTTARRTGLLGLAIERAPGPGWAIDVAIYEIELPEVVDSLESALRRGVGVRVVYHAKAGDPQTAENERHLARLPGPLKKARVTSSIFHQKFVVLTRLAADGRRQPTAVLTGSTNFTSNAVYRQANWPWSASGSAR